MDKTIAISAVLSLSLAACGAASSAPAENAAAQAAASPTAAPRTVIVELFTSEGCSDCPSADSLLSELVARQPVAGAHVVGLSEHVDYWDYLGWKDPFSSAQFSNRQRSYAQHPSVSDGVYTPQMIVDGRVAFVGSHGSAALSAIRSAANRQTLPLSLTQSADAQLKVEIPATTLNEPATVWLALTESGLSSQVARGENGGRTLHHSSVVRSLRPLGSLSSGSAFKQTAEIGALKPSNEVVVFVQGDRSYNVLGATTLVR